MLHGGLFVWRRLIAIDLDRRRREHVITEWNHPCQRSRFDARQCPNAVQQLTVKNLRTPGFVTGRKQIYDGDDHVGRKAGAGVSHFVQALQKQASADKQNETERDLHQDEGRTKPRSTASAENAAALAFKRARKIDMARLNRGHECK